MKEPKSLSKTNLANKLHVAMKRTCRVKPLRRVSIGALSVALAMVASNQFAFLFYLDWNEELNLITALWSLRARRAEAIEKKKALCIPPVTEINVSNINTPAVPKLYSCGWVVDDAVQHWKNLFPDHTYVPLSSSNCPPAISSTDDILISSESHLPACEGVWLDRSDFFEWIPRFAGKVVVRNGESSKLWKGPDGDNVYHMGYYDDSTENRTMRFRALQMSLLEYGNEWWTKLLDPSRRPVSKRERFLVYASKHCVLFRELAFELLASIGIVDRAGPCRGFQGDETRIRDAPAELFNTTDWQNNRVRFSMYRFCLVMENTYQDGYITEKILNAFLAGCVPIWYGTTEVFDIFNKDAFIYYDIKDPRSAVKRVKELESNETAYDEIMKQPILANGEATVREYFSFTKDLGGGYLVKKLHKFLKLGMKDHRL